jgi:phosphomannomutase
LVRASNTTPVLVLRFEGHTAEALERIQKTMLDLLQAVKPDAQFEQSAH